MLPRLGGGVEYGIKFVENLTSHATITAVRWVLSGDHTPYHWHCRSISVHCSFYQWRRSVYSSSRTHSCSRRSWRGVLGQERLRLALKKL